MITLLIIIILIRTIKFKPKNEELYFKEEVEIDRDIAIRNLQEMIKCKTISNIDSSLEDNDEFLKFEKLLQKLYPNIYKTCEFIKVSERSLLYKWKGLKSDKPTVLMAHYDVVPCDYEGWENDPFAGIIENDVLWGRGTLDTKGTVNGILSSVEHLIANSFTPTNDIYIALGGNEEVSGDGQIKIIEYFNNNGIKVNMVLDEGGAVVENVFPGVKEKCAVIGTGEKGFASIKLEINENGGHASTPKPNGAISQLSKACLEIERKPFKQNISKPARQMFDTLGRKSTFLYRMIFANLWLFKGLLNLICIKSGGELNALTRTTTAFTQMSGSDATNVLPVKASITINNRINTGETVESTKEYIKKVIKNDNINVDVLQCSNPSNISEVDCNEWNMLKKAIKSTWNETIVTPYLMIACSDSRHYSKICDKVYRFSGMFLTSQERKSIHGNNEKIPLNTILENVEFYTRLIKQL